MRFAALVLVVAAACGDNNTVTAVPLVSGAATLTLSADHTALWRSPKHPYTRALISAVPIPDPDKERAKPRVLVADDLPSPLHPPSGCVFRTRCPKATEICAAVVPQFESAGTGHEVACHHWRE